MKFQYFAPQIFIQALISATSGYFLSELALGANGLYLIQIKQHCRVLDDGKQHVFEPAEDMRAYRLELHQSGKAKHKRLVDRHRKMIRPEMDQTVTRKHKSQPNG